MHRFTSVFIAVLLCGVVTAGCMGSTPTTVERAPSTSPTPSPTPTPSRTSTTPAPRTSSPPTRPASPTSKPTAAPGLPGMGDGQSIQKITTGGTIGYLTLRRQRWRTTEFGPLFVVDVELSASEEIDLATMIWVYDAAGNQLKQHRYPIGYGKDPKCLNCKRRTVPAGAKVTGTFQLQVTKRVKHGKVTVMPGTYPQLSWRF